VDEHVRLGLSFNAWMLCRNFVPQSRSFLSSDPKNRKDVSKISTSSITWLTNELKNKSGVVKLTKKIN